MPRGQGRGSEARAGRSCAPDFRPRMHQLSREGLVLVTRPRAGGRLGSPWCRLKFPFPPAPARAPRRRRGEKECTHPALAPIAPNPGERDPQTARRMACQALDRSRRRQAQAAGTARRGLADLRQVCPPAGRSSLHFGCSFCLLLRIQLR